MKKYIIYTVSGVVVLLTIMTISSCRNTDLHPAEEEKKVMHTKEDVSADIFNKYRKKTHKKTIKPKHRPKYIMRKSVVEDSAFTTVPLDDMALIIKPKKSVVPLSAFIIKKGLIKSLKVKDTLYLPEINGVEFVLNIDKRMVHKNRSITLEASIKGESDTNRNMAVMTEGSKTTFITVYSSEGVYEIEIFGENGYIYAARDIKNKWIDYSKTDVVISKR